MKGRAALPASARAVPPSTLADEGTATVLTYAARAQVGGKLAQIGSRLVDATARKMADDFFSRFTAIVGEPAPEAAPAQPPAPSSVTGPVASGQGAAPNNVYVPWAAILVVVALAGLLAWMK